MAKGKLIVLEGIDGSGKSAHYRRICEKLKRDGIAYDHIVFPRYDKESSALIRMYLYSHLSSRLNIRHRLQICSPPYLNAYC